MPVFPSGQWMEAFCRQLAAQPDAGRAVEALAGTYRFVIRPGGPLAARHVYDVTIVPGSNGSPRVTLAPDPPTGGADGASPTLELSADYQRWRQLIMGTLDIPVAVMLGRLRIRGDLGRITSRAAEARPLLDALRAVDTQWLEG